MITQLIIYILINYGLSNIICNSTLFLPIREYIGTKSNFLYLLLTCMMCVGMYSGVLTSLMVFSPSNSIMYSPLYLSWFLDGLLTSGSVWLIHTLQEKLER